MVKLPACFLQFKKHYEMGKSVYTKYSGVCISENYKVIHTELSSIQNWGVVYTCKLRRKSWYYPIANTVFHGN